MTRRDFEMIAEVIAERVRLHEHRTLRVTTLHELALDFADRLRATNPRFDRDRFMAACGFKGE